MTDPTILVFNAGSATLKFAAFRCGANAAMTACLHRGEVDLPSGGHAAAVRSAFATIERDVARDEVAAVGHRIVHGGPHYEQPTLIDARVAAALAALQTLAPLHQAQGLAIVDAVRALQPETPQFASFDTAFHATMPPVAKRFALPGAWFERGVRRYGFHGLSYESIALQLAQRCSAAARRRTVVAHLGSGASLCAMRDGASIATTMSFTPTDGLVMATRCGALDPSVVSYLEREHAMSPAQVDRLLNFESGLLGVSGVSGDIRVLIDSDRADARLAVDLFVYRAVVEAGAMVAALGGLDALVFTGGIGTHRADIRQRICDGLSWLGIACDTQRNVAGNPRFDAQASRVSLWNVPTDEESVIAQHAARLLQTQTPR